MPLTHRRHRGGETLPARRPIRMIETQPSPRKPRRGPLTAGALVVAATVGAIGGIVLTRGDESAGQVTTVVQTVPSTVTTTVPASSNASATSTTGGARSVADI